MRSFNKTIFVRNLLVLSGILLSSFASYGQVSGRVFRDFNASGVFDSSATFKEVGLSGIIVTAYNSAGASVGTATSNGTGDYTISGVSGAVRVEFTGIGTSDFASAFGSSSGTSVQFVTAPATAVNFGVNYPKDYCHSTNPELITNCYVSGDQSNGAYRDDIVLLSFPYDAGSRNVQVYTSTLATDVISTIYDVPNAHTLAVAAKNVGTTFGLAFARNTERLYASSYFKKHTGFGHGADATANNADDAGAIYVLNANSGGLLATFTVPNATTNAHDVNDYVRDNDNISWNATGKTSLGGMDISDDNQTLYVMNLENRTLYALNATTGAVVNSAATTGLFPNTCAGCTQSNDIRPFAVEFYKGKVYIGLVYSAETSGDSSQLRAYIYTADPTTLAFSATPVFEFALNYPRGKAAGTGPADWRAWTPTYTNISTNLATRVVYPMPLFTGITFDNGNLIIGLRDRVGDIVGNQSKDNPNVADPNYANLYQARTAGDFLRATGSPSTGWTLENAGRTNGQGTATQNTGQGVGDAEFYHGDAYPASATPTTSTNYHVNGVYYTITAGTSTVTNGSIGNTQGFGVNHDELSLGTSTQIAGMPDMVAVVFDPTVDNGPEGFHDAGIRWLNNTTGAWAQSYRIYNGDGATTANLGKANGLGELLSLCKAQPIEIGNRVFTDTDNDGVQDAGEAGIDGVTVKLFEGTTEVGSTTTANGGQYYFTNTNVTGGVKFSTAYEIRIATAQTPLNTLSLSTTDAGTNDLIDNDGTTSGANAIKAFTTGNAGENNHSYDFGFRPALACTEPTITSVSADTATCTGGGANADAAVRVTGIVGMASYAYSTTGTTGLFAATATASTASSIDLTGLTNPAISTTYTFRIWGTDTTCYNDTTVVLNPKNCIIPKICNTIIIVNNDFENGRTNEPMSFAGGFRYRLASGGDLVAWDTATSQGNEFRIQSSMAVSGNYFVHAYSTGTTAAGTDACLAQYNIPVSPNTKYTLCVYAADAKSDGKKSGISLEIQERGRNGSNSAAFHYEVDTLSDNPNWRDDMMSIVPWTQQTYTFTTASNTTNISLWLSANAINGDTSFIVYDLVCLQPAIIPTITNVAADTATCTGGVVNSDAAVHVTGISGMASYAYTTDGTTNGLFASTATASTASSIDLTGISNPTSATTYTFRIWGTDTTCWNDTTVVLNPTTCLAPCIAPTITGVSADTATCTGGVANSDAAVHVTGIIGMVSYAYSTNGTTGLFAATATASTASSIDLTGITNPASATTYTFRIWGTDTTCYNDTTVVLNPATCLTPCVAPTITNVAADTATCTGGVANSDAAVRVTGIVGMASYAYSTSGGTGLFAATATASTASSIDLTGLSNPASATTYTFRIWGTDTTCFNDTTMVLNPSSCGTTPCTRINIQPAGLPGGFVGTAYTAQVSASGGTGPYRFQWYVGSTGVLPQGLSMDSTGLVSGIPTSVGSYSVKIVVVDANVCADTLDPATIDIRCEPITAGTVSSIQATCNGGTANNNAQIVTNGWTNSTRVAYGTTGSTGLIYATATPILGGGVMIQNLPNPAASTTYTLRFFSSDTTCFKDTTVILNRRICTSSNPDITLIKTVNNSMATQGANVIFTIKVKNEGIGNATGLTVHDTLQTGMTFISTNPSSVYNPTTHLWTIGNLNAGDSVVLAMTVRMDSVGVSYNNAEVHAMNEVDIDSSPNNGSTSEDDIDRVCVSVPVPLCTAEGRTLTLTIPDGYSNIKWYKDNVEIVGQTTRSLVVSTTGNYTFSADQSTCPVEGCCPIMVVEGNCQPVCKPVICLPVVLSRQ